LLLTPMEPGERECRKSKPRPSSGSSRTRSIKQRGVIPTLWPPASSPLWRKQAIVSARPTGERTPRHAPRGQNRDSSIEAQTGIPGSSPAIPRPARRSSRHQANAPSGGQVTDIDLGAFLSGLGSPEHEALLRLIGASIFNPRGAEADDEPLAVNTGRKWSDAEHWA
jgi:hypothetical protein